MEIFIVTTVLLGLGIAGISIKIWVKKNGEFSGTCASNNPHLNEENKACEFCGAIPNEQCQKDDKPAIA